MMSNTTKTSEKLWTPANIVTLLRICGVPVFVVAIISPWPEWISIWPDASMWKEWVAAAIFIIIAATDALDGYLARSRDEVTNFGKFMDPLADKILVAAALLALIELGVLPSWVALIILCREFIVSGIRMVAATQGVVIAASWYGKAKTVVQIVAIVLFIIKDSHMVGSFSSVLSDRLYLISWGVMIIALLLTIVSMLDYFVKAKRAFKLADAATEFDESLPGPLFDEATTAQARAVLAKADNRSATLGFAESCTGGMITTLLTAVPGSSSAVQGGVVSYSNDIKHVLLDVREDTLETYGAVSEQTACEMAQGARKALNVDVAFSVTGIAGPEGDSSEKPVGTVWVGCSTVDDTHATHYVFKGDRDQVRLQTTKKVMELLETELVKD